MLVAAACGSDDRGGRRPPETMTGTPADSLRFELRAPDEVRAGEPVPITLRVTNTGVQPVELHLLGRDAAFDVTVTSEDGAVVWQRLEGATLLGILQIRVLAPGAALEFRAVWTQQDRTGRRVAPGTYTLQGILPTDAEPLRTPTARLAITPR